MAEKMTKLLLKELDGLVETLNSKDPDERHVAMTRLESYERAGKIPLSSLLQMADESNPSMMMYGIAALGRNGTPEAVKKLMALLKKHQAGHRILLETVVDALGEAGDKSAAPALLELVGIQFGMRARLRGILPRGKKEPTPEENRQRLALALPVARAVEKFNDPSSAAALAGFLDSPESLVRWHAIRAIVNATVTDFNDKLRAMAEEDSDEVVREAAQIALNDLSALPRHLNN